MKTEIKKYKNGITLAVTKMEGFDSVAFNIFVKTGSINEVKGNYGISHFIEHMLFKGTEKRSAYMISKQLDSLGANVNAYTDKEETTYFFKTSNDNLEKCVDILSDMFFHSVFDAKEMKREKRVVCEEISMYSDDAYSKSELLNDALIYNGTPYGFDVAGSKQSVLGLTKQKILNYMKKFYNPENVIVAFSGNVNMKQAEKLMEKYFLNEYGLSLNDEVKYEEKQEKLNPMKTIIDKRFNKNYKNNEQSNVCISYKTFDEFDQRKHALSVLNIAFGFGMSSRLFQLIREKLGLVYNISTNVNLNQAGGNLTIHFATTTKNTALALKEIRKEIQNLVDNGFTMSEFEDSKNNLITSIKLAYESTSAMNLKVCKNLKDYGKVIQKEQMVENIQNVKYEDVNKLFKQLFNTEKYCITYVGNNTRINLNKNYSLE